MIFLTIGTYEPFDRLVQTVDELVGNGHIQEEVIAQICQGVYQPKHLKGFDVLEKSLYEDYMTQSSIVISHAGMGSIITAATLGKPMIVMPRLSKYREAVNDHQLDTAREFEAEGMILVANDPQELLDKIALADQFKPQSRQDQCQTLMTRISVFLESV